MINKHNRMSRLAVALVLALGAATVQAQTTSATLSGRVVGDGGEPVAGAEVTIEHLPSGTTTRAVTDSNGRYASRGLRVGGPYKVTAIAEGMEGSSQEDVYLVLGDSAPVNIDLAAADATLDAVEVIGVAQATVFSPDKIGAGTDISNEQINSFPSINRNLQDYVRLDPRITQTDKGRNEISAGGQNTRYNAIRVDGISINDTFGLESNGLSAPRQPISMDAIDAINVSVATYDTAIAGGTGAVINAVTKSGTNEFHGSVYSLYRDNDWSGSTEGRPRPTIFDNELTYGLTVGGPIIQDKLFFFFNYEKFDGKDQFDGLGAGFGTSDSGATNRVNITTAQVNEIIDISRSVWGFDPGTLALPSLDTETEEYALKIDWNISDRHRANFRYANSDQSRPNLNNFGTNNLALSTQSYVRDFEIKTYTAQLFSDWNETFSTEAKISYRDYSAVRTPPQDLPSIQVQVGNASLFLGTEQNTHANILETETLNGYFLGNVYLGDHTIKGGFDYEENEIYNLFGRRINGVYRFANIAQYRAGVSNQYQLFVPRGNDLDNMAAEWSLENIGVFLQDTWSVNSNLTVNFGVRMDRPRTDEDPLFNPAASAAFGRRNDTSVGGELFQPRAGFNYTFDTERQTQLRGGVGLFQGAAATVWLSNAYSNNGLAYSDFFFGQGIQRFTPDPRNQQSVLPAGTPQTQSIDFVEEDIEQPSVWKGNLALDHELPWWGMVASLEAVLTSVNKGLYYQSLNVGAATAVGQDGRLIYWNTAGRNPACFDVNGTPIANAAAVATGCARAVGTGFATNTSNRANRNTAFNDVILVRNTDKGDGEQFTLSVQKPFGDDNWFWQASYTYTNAREVSPLTSSTSGSNFLNNALFQINEDDASTSSYEIRDRFTFATSYRHYFFENYKTEFTLFYEGRSGKPFSYVFDNDANGDSIFGNDLLYIPRGRGDVRFGSQAEEDAFFAFIESNEYLRSRMGQVAERNGDNSPWVHTFDVRISQEIPGFMDGHKGELFIDLQNIGNMIKSDWGNINEVPFPLQRGVVEYGGIAPDGKYVYRFNTPDNLLIYDQRGVSRWSAQVGFKYSF